MRKLLIIPLLISMSCSSIRSLDSKKWGNKPPMEKEEKGPDYSASSFESFVSSSDDTSDSDKEEKIPFKLDYDEKLYQFWMKYYTKKKNKARFSRHLTNGEKFKKIVHQIYREEGLPEGLFYVGLIESGFNTHIKSHASAKGPWQFMSGTAKDYGLRVDRWVDERTNIHKATRAAAAYFKDLYNIFGSWELALCAYNAGENRIIRAIRKGNTRDYKELVKKRLIPKETTYYIPKVAAAMELAKNRHQYGINVAPNPDRKYAEAVVLKVASPFSLNKVGKDLGVSMETLKTFNPDIKTGWVHITKRRKYRLILPRFVKDKLAHTKVGGEKIPHRYVSKGSKKTSVYKVKRGDNLITIAKRLGTSVGQLKKANRLRSNRIYVGQKLKTRSYSKTRSGRKVASIHKFSTYRVRKGDNLTSIAKKHGTTISRLKKMNKMRKTSIRIGQRLKVPQMNTKIYVVRRGDNLTKISKKFGVSIKKILDFNSIKSGVIFPRQKLRIPLNS